MRKRAHWRVVYEQDGRQIVGPRCKSRMEAVELGRDEDFGDCMRTIFRLRITRK